MNTRSGYFVEPAVLERIVDSFAADAEPSETFAAKCRRIGSLLATQKHVQGAENISTSGPLVIIKTHPCHYDGLLLDDAFQTRPDLRLLAKPSALMTRLPSENTLLMRKKDGHGDYEDIQRLQSHLSAGKPLLATPWGSLNHQARANVSRERAIQNVIRFASFASATVLPVTIEAVWPPDHQFPLEEARITYHDPILPLSGTPDADAIAEVIGDMYDQYAA